MEYPEVVREYIEKECVAGRLLGPLDPALFPEVHTSRFGVIPRSDPGRNSGPISSRGGKS